MQSLPPEQVALERVDEGAISALRDAVGAERVLTDPAGRERFAGDETEALRVLPEVALLPESRAQVAAALRVAYARRLAVVPRGAGTGLSSGALPVYAGIVLSLERMNRIGVVDERDLVVEVEAGAVTGEIQRQVEACGLFYPPDPSSRDSCTIGGNLAEDAAGPRSAKYGTTRRWVLGLEAVLADGTPLDTGSRCRKDATGFDLTQLLVGSEGTLAVITAATLRLVAKPRATLTAVVPFATLESAASAVEQLFSEGLDPAACELMEEAALAAVARSERLPAPLAGSGAILLVELDGDELDALHLRALRLDALCRALGGGEAIVADDAAGQRRLWQVRRRIGEAVKSLSVYKEADTVVPRSRLVELVRAARSAAARHGLEAIVYGHAGDGNLHVNLLRGGLDERSWAAKRDAAEEQLFRAAIDLGGRVTGEHGVGWTQRRYLPLALSPAAIALSRAIKQAFDPLGILNPGKIFPDARG